MEVLMYFDHREGNNFFYRFGLSEDVADGLFVIDTEENDKSKILHPSALVNERWAMKSMVKVIRIVNDSHPPEVAYYVSG